MQSIFDSEDVIEPGERNFIDSVTVFTDQAQVKRTAETSFSTGVNIISLEVTAFQVYKDSVQAEVFANGSIVGVQYKEIPLKQFRQKELEQLETEKKQLSRERKLIDQKKENELKRRKFIDSVARFSDVQIPQEIQTASVSVEKMRAILEFISTGYDEISRTIKGLEIQIEELDDSLKVIEKKLTGKKLSSKKSMKIIEVIFDSKEEQEGKIHIFYNVGFARWLPVYKVDVEDNSAEITLQQFAKISQTTGEDWNDVQISVSNAVPIQNLRLPDLSSWLIDIYRAPVMPMAAAPMESMMTGAVETEVTLDDLVLGSAEFDEPESAGYTQAELREQGIAFEFDLPLTYRISSGGDDSTLPILQKKLPSDFYHYAVPKVNSHVYFVCAVRPDSNLLPGAINVYYGGRYVASTQLHEKSVGEPLVFNLGVDRAVKVSRQQIIDKKAETFFGMVDRSSLAREIEYLTIIENLKDEPVTLKYLDHIPVPKTDIIQIKGIELNPEPIEKEYQSRDGVLLWNLQLAPGEVREVRIKFYIKHPKNEAPVGL